MLDNLRFLFCIHTVRVWAKEELSSSSGSDDDKKPKKKKKKKRPGTASDFDSSDFDSRPTTAVDSEKGVGEDRNGGEENIENDLFAPGDDSIEGYVYGILLC